MDHLFFVDRERDTQKTYKDLLSELSLKRSIGHVINSDKPYEVFIDLVLSLINGVEVELVDSDLSHNEIEALGIKSIDQRYTFGDAHWTAQNSFADLLDLIDIGKSSWRLTLYTSGTTGRPKKVTHTFDSLTRSVKIGVNHKDDIWVFAYNPTHFAGLQVFFQAFLNMNPIVFVFDTPRSKVFDIMQEEKVTHISATPTFYRNTLVTFEKPVNTIRRATSGGEKFDPYIETIMRKAFPNARLNNIYASTEAGSLFAAEGDVFKISDRIADKVRIGEDGELLVHKSLLGQSVDILLDEDWYHTGDIVELTDQKQFRFVSRKSEMINVGGYKVNPYEVEEAILNIEGIEDAIVNSRTNRVTGSILVASVVRNSEADHIDEEFVTKELSKILQQWKIPRLIKFVDKIELTRTGKKARN